MPERMPRAASSPRMIPGSNPVGRGIRWVDCNDTTPHPATSTKWKYRAIYRATDQRVGIWSLEVATYIGG